MAQTRMQTSTNVWYPSFFFPTRSFEFH